MGQELDARQGQFHEWCLRRSRSLTLTGGRSDARSTYPYRKAAGPAGQPGDSANALRERWALLLSELDGEAKNVTNPLREAGYTDLYVDRYRDAIRVWFGSRPCGVAERRESGVTFDVARGAEAVFFLADDGQVKGLRRPYQREADTRPYEQFVDLGSPGKFPKEAFGHAVADFLEWVLTGPGVGGLGLLF